MAGFYILLFRRTLWAARGNLTSVRGFVERIPAFLLDKQVHSFHFVAYFQECHFVGYFPECSVNSMKTTQSALVEFFELVV